MVGAPRAGKNGKRIDSSSASAMSSLAERHPILLFLACFTVLMVVALSLAALAP